MTAAPNSGHYSFGAAGTVPANTQTNVTLSLAPGIYQLVATLEGQRAAAIGTVWIVSPTVVPYWDIRYGWATGTSSIAFAGQGTSGAPVAAGGDTIILQCNNQTGGPVSYQWQATRLI